MTKGFMKFLVGLFVIVSITLVGGLFFEGGQMKVIGGNCLVCLGLILVLTRGVILKDTGRYKGVAYISILLCIGIIVLWLLDVFKVSSFIYSRYGILLVLMAFISAWICHVYKAGVKNRFAGFVQHLTVVIVFGCGVMFGVLIMLGKDVFSNITVDIWGLFKNIGVMGRILRISFVSAILGTLIGPLVDDASSFSTVDYIHDANMDDKRDVGI